MNNILVRSLSGGVYIAILILAVLFYAQLSYLVYGIILFIALYEYGRLLSFNDLKLNSFVNIGVGVSVYLIIGLVELSYLSKLFLGFIPILLFLPIVYSLFDTSKNSLLKAILTLGGYLYLLMPLILVHYLYQKSASGEIVYFWPVLGMMILTWTSDTFAYLSGRFFGKTKLFERISPKKTWEGVIGGTLFSVLAAFFIDYFDSEQDLLFWLVLGVLVPAFGIIGDLIESHMKRTVGVKDSGDFIPGHGGILDRIDAMLFSIPLTFSWLYISNFI